MTRRTVRGSGTYFCVLTIIAVVAFYICMELNVLDTYAGPQDWETKPAAQIVEEKEAAMSAGTVSEPEDKQETKEEETKEEETKEEKEEPKPKAEPKEGQCNNFDHGDVTPLEDVTSIFNCGSESGTCHWYYPSKFLDESCGVGKEFVSQINDMKKLYDSKQLWLSGPPIVLPGASIKPALMRPNQFRAGPWPRHNLSMTHVHKTGGTSLVTAFGSVLGKGAKGKRLTVYFPAPIPPTEEAQIKMEENTGRPRRKPRSSIIYGSNWNESSTFLDGAVKYRKPDEWGERDHTLFGVVRDPAERFISAIGQATGAFGSTANGIGKQLLNECLRETSRDTLRCFVDLMQTNSTWIEVHFTPMVLEISFATIYKDIPVAIFPFTEVPNLLLELGSNPSQKKKDGHVAGYRKASVLTNMTVADYDDDMLKNLCTVYKMDAMFMKHIGMTTRCEGVIEFD